MLFSGCRPGADEASKKDSAGLSAPTETAEFTLRMVFYGLIALVPLKDAIGEKTIGATVLFLNDSRHKPVIAVMEDKGICEGTVSHCVDEEIPSHEERFAAIQSIKGVEVLTSAAQTSWIAEPDGGKNLPTSDQESRWASWIVDLSTLSPGRLNMDCLTRTNCPAVTAALVLKGGTLSACHLSHLVISVSGWKRPYLRSYIMRNDNGDRKPTRRAVADAAMIEMKVPGDYVTFKLGTGGKVLKLKPNAGEVEVIFSNSDYSPSGPGHRHFKKYYELSVSPKAANERHYPQVAKNHWLNRHVGSCERSLASFDSAYSDGADGGHDHAKCDVVSYGGF